MVVAHAGCDVQANDFIYMFHMPLFFIMSGYCFKAKYTDNVLSFVWKRVKGVWWPYVKWGLLFLALHNVFFYLHIYDDVYGWKGWGQRLYTMDDFWRLGKNVVKLKHSEQLLGGYWFLKELFYASIIGIVVIKALSLTKFNKSGGVICIILFAGLCCGDVSIAKLSIFPTTWMATLFFLVGYEMRQFHAVSLSAISERLSVNWQIVLFVVTFIIVVVGSHCWQTDMLQFSSGRAVPYCITAILGTMMVYCFSCFVMRGGDTFVKRFLLFCGRHTLAVLTWHFLSFKLVSLLMICIYGLDIKRLGTHPVISKEELVECGVAIDYSYWWVAYAIVGLAVPLTFLTINYKLLTTGRAGSARIKDILRKDKG